MESHPICKLTQSVLNEKFSLLHDGMCPACLKIVSSHSSSLLELAEQKSCRVNSFQFPDFNLEKLPAGSVLKLEQDISCSGVNPPPNNAVYVREASRKLWCDLVGCMYTPTHRNPTNLPRDYSDMSSREWKVYGSPGIGKSLEVFLAACHFACKQKTLYIRYDDGDGSVNVLLGYPVTSHSSRVTSESSPVLEETIPVQLCQFDIILKNSFMTIDWEKWLQHYKPQRVVAIGCNEEILSAIGGECYWYGKESNQIIPCILCTSMPSSKLRQESFGERRMTIHQMDSWTLEEYIDAAEKGVIDMTPDEVIVKYYYIGGSFTMITWELEAIMAFLRAKLTAVPNIEDLSISIGGEHSKVAVNSLRNTYNSQYSILSRFIISELSRTQYNSLDTTLPYLRHRLALPDKTEFQGCVTQYHCLSLMHQASQASGTYSMAYLSSTADNKKIGQLCRLSIPTVTTLPYDGSLEDVDISEGAVMIEFEKYDYYDIDAIVINHVIDPTERGEGTVSEDDDTAPATAPDPVATTKAEKKKLIGGDRKVVYFLLITDNPQHKFNVERLHATAVSLSADTLHFLIVIRHKRISDFQKCTIPQRVIAEWMEKYGQEQAAKRQKIGTGTGSQAAKGISFHSAIVLYDSSH